MYAFGRFLPNHLEKDLKRTLCMKGGSNENPPQPSPNIVPRMLFVAFE